MPKGTVKFYNEQKGFGFITPQDGSKDLFVHSTKINGQIRDGDSVDYEVENTPKGPAAKNVKKV